MPDRVWPSGTRAQAPEAVLQEVALVARAKREVLLRVHRHRLRREDLEDCYSQATLELLSRVRAGATYDGRRHVANAIEQRFLSRIHDRRRALSGRSPMQAAFESATPVGGPGESELHVVDARAEPERLAIARDELRRVQSLVGKLSNDQQLVLACQVGSQISCEEFCRMSGWSAEKYRKVAQRARARLRTLMHAEENGVPDATGTS